MTCLGFYWPIYYNASTSFDYAKIFWFSFKILIATFLFEIMSNPEYISEKSPSFNFTLTVYLPNDPIYFRLLNIGYSSDESS